jgi:hypothetical protein
MWQVYTRPTSASDFFECDDMWMWKVFTRPFSASDFLFQFHRLRKGSLYVVWWFLQTRIDILKYWHLWNSLKIRFSKVDTFLLKNTYKTYDRRCSYLLYDYESLRAAAPTSRNRYSWCVHSHRFLKALLCLCPGISLYMNIFHFVASPLSPRNTGPPTNLHIIGIVGKVLVCRNLRIVLTLRWDCGFFIRFLNRFLF